MRCKPWRDYLKEGEYLFYEEDRDEPMSFPGFDGREQIDTPLPASSWPGARGIEPFIKPKAPERNDVEVAKSIRSVVLTSLGNWQAGNVLWLVSARVCRYLYKVKTVNITEIRNKLDQLIDQTNEMREPIRINGKKHNAVMVGEEDWHNIQETLYLTAIPGMRESIIEGMKTPISETPKVLEW